MSDCQKLKIWKLQCKFSELAEKYMNNMLLGISCPEQLDYLKTFRRALLLLNRNLNDSNLLETVPYRVSLFNGKGDNASATISYVDAQGNTVIVNLNTDLFINPVAAANFCAVLGSYEELSFVGGPTSSLTVNFYPETPCDEEEGCETSNISSSTQNEILETLEKKY
jgi:hypothetical protein